MTVAVIPCRSSSEAAIAARNPAAQWTTRRRRGATDVHRREGMGRDMHGAVEVAGDPLPALADVEDQPAGVRRRGR